MKKKKIILIIVIVIMILAILSVIFGIIDYIRVTKNKEPIFIYHTVGNTYIDVAPLGMDDIALPNIAGDLYYGVGYSVSTCPGYTDNYKFQLGHKQKEQCFTSLTCRKTDDSNVERTSEYSFLNGKLYRINRTIVVPIEMFGDTEENSLKWVEEFSEIYGCGASFEKIDETKYKVVEVCNLNNMLESDILEVYDPNLSSIERPGTTKEEIIDYYHKWMVCE